MALIPTPEFPKFIRSCRQNLADIFDVVARNTDILGPIEHVPFVGLAMKVFNVLDVWQQQKLARNAVAFLEVIRNAPHEQIADRLDELRTDPRFADAIDESILATMMDSSYKERSRLHAKLILAVSEGKITVDEFIQMSEMVQSSIIAALRALPEFFAATHGRPMQRNLDPGVHEPLLNTLGVSARSGNLYRISDLGKKLYIVCFDGVIDESITP